jgi:hypothetical protein
MLLTRILLLLIILLLSLAYFAYLRKRMNYWENKEYFTSLASDRENKEYFSPLASDRENKEYFTTQLAQAPPPLKYTRAKPFDPPNYLESDNIVYLKTQVDQLVLLKQQVAELQEASNGHDKALAALAKDSYLNAVDPPGATTTVNSNSLSATNDGNMGSLGAEGGNATAVMGSFKQKAIDAKI